MFLRSTTRKKDGKVHRYWSVVENHRVRGGRVVQRHVLYLGEISEAQRVAWCESFESLDRRPRRHRQADMFAQSREAPELSSTTVQVKLDGMRLSKARQFGAGWLGLELWGCLDLDAFWRERLTRSRKGTDWRNVLKTLTLYRLIDPGSEWRLHRQWFERSAVGDLLGEDAGVAQPDTLYRCLDKLLPHKQALFTHLKGIWEERFGASFEILLYDLTSTYFECVPPEGESIRKFGYSRDKRPDCVQVVIALIVTPQGFPLAYEVMAGNTTDSTTLAEFVEKIQAQYGRAQRIWVTDRGIPTEAALEMMRGTDPPVRYLVGTPKGRLTKLEQSFLGQPWVKAREQVQVKLLAQGEELYVLAHSAARVDKERAMRRRRLKKLIARLRELQEQKLTHDELLMKLGAARSQAGRAYGLIDIQMPKEPIEARAQARTQRLRFRIDRDKLRIARRREGRYLLRTNLTEQHPAKLWAFYIQLTEVEQAFKELKGDLPVRPIYHQKDERIEAHIFVAFLAYCLQVTLKAKLKPLASGLTPRAVLEKFAAIQMLDVHLPTTDNRELVLSRYTEPEKDLQLLLMRLKLALPEQPPPKISTSLPQDSLTATAV